MEYKLNTKISYSQLFDNSTCHFAPQVKLADRFCGFSSLYEVALGWLKIYEQLSQSERFGDKVLAKYLTKLLPSLETVVYWGYTFDGTFFVQDLILSAPRILEAPERKGKIALGEAGLVLMAELLVNRVNTVAYRALRGMKCVDQSNKDVRLDSLEQLEKITPTYFEWKGSSSKYHLEFLSDVVKMWRTLDESVIETVKKGIDESKKLALEEREKKMVEREKKTKQKEHDFLSKVEEKKKVLSEERPLIKVYGVIEHSTTNAWIKPEEPKSEEPKPEEPKPEESKLENENKKQAKGYKKRKSSRKNKNVKQTEHPEEQKDNVHTEDEEKMEDNSGKWETQKRDTYKKYKNDTEEKRERPQKPPRQFILRGTKNVVNKH